MPKSQTKPQLQSIPVIEQFLQEWKERANTYYQQTIKRMEELREEFSNTIESYNNRHRLTEEKRKEIEKDHEKKWQAYKKYKKEYNSITSIVDGYHSDEWQQRIEKTLNKEVENKRKTLIFRIEKKAGNILDASNLYIGVNGEINGTIKGTIKIVNVETIYAGGYNIQCLHYRVLIK